MYFLPQGHELAGNIKEYLQHNHRHKESDNGRFRIHLERDYRLWHREVTRGECERVNELILVSFLHLAISWHGRTKSVSCVI